MFCLAYSDSSGNVYDEPVIEALAFSGSSYCELSLKEMIPFPCGTELAMLPGRMPLGKYEGKGGVVRELEGIKPYPMAVSALLPNGYTRLLLPAYKRRKKAPNLPLFSYSAIAFLNGNFYIAAHETEKSERWNPANYCKPELKSIVRKRLLKDPKNRLLSHLSNCALVYGCYNAQNIFFGRWEGGIPVSPTCNSNCFGCISHQKESGFPSPQERISFTPSVKEISSIGVKHLTSSKKAMLSFGQGCEGEPTLKGPLIFDAIKSIRSKTDRGTIHLNTNGSRPDVLSSLIDAGLDSVRISINSLVEANYNTYFRPSSFTFSDVKKSFSIALEKGIFTSVNLLVMPGFTDREEEIKPLCKFLKEHPVSKIQLRNLNVDQELFFRLMPPAKAKVRGMLKFINLLKNNFSHIKIGSVNSPLKK